MSLSEFYKPFWTGLTDDQLAKVGSFSGEFLTAKTLGNFSKMEMLIKEATSFLVRDPDAIDTLIGIVNYSSRYGTPMEKEAASRLGHHLAEMVKSDHEKLAGDKYDKMIAAGALGLSAIPLAMHLGDKASTHFKIKSALRQIIADHPELRNDPNTPRYFQALVDFSPKIAANALVAGNIMKQMHQVGPGALTPSLIKEISDVGKLQSEVARTQREPFSAAAAGVSGFGKARSDSAEDPYASAEESRRAAKELREQAIFKQNQDDRAQRQTPAPRPPPYY